MQSAARNIEIKARAHSWSSQIAKARSLSDTPEETFRQHDVFFTALRGRLKLRSLPHAPDQLIGYTRTDSCRPNPSDYRIFPTEDGAALQAILTAALGVNGQVTKTRTLFRVGQTRIHFDDVAHLGFFIELEVVMEGDQSPADGRRHAETLMRELHIRSCDLIAPAYVDLLADIPAPASGYAP